MTDLHEEGFRAGVEAMREKILAYLDDPVMRQAFVLLGARVLPVVASEIRGFHPDYVKA